MRKSTTLRETRLLELLLTAEGRVGQRDASQRLGLRASELDEVVGELQVAGVVMKSDDGQLLPRLVSPEATLARLVDIQTDRLEDALEVHRSAQAVYKALGDRLIPLNAERALGGQARVLSGQTRITEVLEDAAYRARREILSLHPGTPLPADSLAESRMRNQRALDRGVVMRVVHLKSMLQVPHGQAHVGALLDAGVEVRITPVLPFRLIIVDRTLAFTSMRSSEGEAMAMELQGADLGHLLRQIFDFCWLSAQSADLPQKSSPTDPAMSEREMAVVRMLFEGRKDESMARALGISLRTMRRLMTDVMEKLGAESRFQAGVRATEMGLVGGAARP